MNLSKEILGNQKRLLAIGFTALMGLGVAFMYLTTEDKPVRDQSPVSKKVDLPTDKIDVREVWISEVHADRKVLEGELEYLKKQVLESKRQQEAKSHEIDALHNELNKLREDVTKQSRAPEITQVQQEAVADVYQEAQDYATELKRARAFSRREFCVSEMFEEAPDKVQHVDRVIPAGTTVKAIMVSSVDASCSITAAADPQPVKLRILDNAHLPHSVRVQLKGGIVLASAYGDLSSERVKMRIERLTQVRPNGEFVETAVTGYVTGADGKYGVKGCVVDRSGKLVQSAAISGFLSGVSEFLKATTNAQDIRDATRGLPNTLRWDLIKEGSASGMSNSLDRLSEYYIARAEQILPIIEIPAGVEVDITFGLGTDVGDLNTKYRVQEMREESRRRGDQLW